MDIDESMEFIIEVSLDKGLNLSSSSISGNNVIFSGGTGVLPVYIFVRILISEKSTGDSIQQDEEFDENLGIAKFNISIYYSIKSKIKLLNYVLQVLEFQNYFGN